MNARYDTCVPTLSTLLTCMDLEEIFVLLRRERPRGKPVLDEVKLEQFGNENFKKFVAHVCTLEHVASNKGEFRSRPISAFVYILSSKPIRMRKLRNV